MMVTRMQKWVFALAGIAVIALLAFALLYKPGGETETQEPELVAVPRTQLAAAKQEIDRGSVVVIDVRDVDSYVAGHIPGALQIPLARVEGEVNYLPRDRPILTYCT
jgi:3-mercaptopyruvate sulfurtransferase SseA